MIDYASALQGLLENVRQLANERCAVSDAVGRIVANDVHSTMALPSFDHAAMDGYAMCAAVPLATGTVHAVAGSQAAGDAARDAQDAAWEIMTGAQLPAGLNAVAILENTEVLERRDDGMPVRIRLLQPLRAGENVRYAGSDVEWGATVLRAGTRIEPAHVMLLAALGVTDLQVVRHARVAVVCTGKELQGDRTAPLDADRIHNSNGPYLVAALQALGATVLTCDTVDDTAATYRDALDRAIAAKADLVISTGAVSKGRFDFVPELLRDAGANVLFHHVAIRPGKPMMCARHASGTMVLALPGTPMAVAAGMRFFVTPALRHMAGQSVEQTCCAILDSPQHPKAGLRHFLRGQLYLSADGRLHVIVPSEQQPFRVLPFTTADAWIELAEDAGPCPVGTLVQVRAIADSSLLRVSLEPDRSVQT